LHFSRGSGQVSTLQATLNRANSCGKFNSAVGAANNLDDVADDIVVVSFTEFVILALAEDEGEDEKDLERNGGFNLFVNP